MSEKKTPWYLPHQGQYLGNCQASAASLTVAGWINVKQINAKQIVKCGALIDHSSMSWSTDKCLHSTFLVSIKLPEGYIIPFWAWK